ncbi:RNA methyltransferase [Spirochaetia bacterium]|nr:RNA methyltransferase [Spirochaetia bacterium]
MVLDDIIIVLSHPQESGNVGAVCRVMKNCGISSLRIAGDFKPDIKTIRDRSVHAFDVWQNVKFFDTIQNAVSDCSIVIGTTRRRGAKRKSISLTPQETASYITGRPSAPIAIVFGNERTGLEANEIDLCNIASHIPASNVFPSFNLSHAVGIYCYELFSAQPQKTNCEKCDIKGSHKNMPWHALCSADVQKLSTDICDILESAGFYKIAGRADQEHFFADIFARAGITKSESKLMREIFNKVIRIKKL